MRKKIKSAMTYPMVLVVIMVAAFFGLMIFIIPQIGKTIWLDAYQLAQTYWQQLDTERRLSDEFRAIASASQQALAQHTLPALNRMAQ